jgi:hypothetical protein
MSEGDRLVGSAEVLEMLGPPGKPLPPSTLSRWRKSGEFPDPEGEPRMGPVWRLRDVKAFARRRNLPRDD